MIPNKLYFSISEVAEMTGVKPHVLRYWETEFPDLRPKKNRAGNRSYRERDIKMVMTIRDLLYQQGYTIQGARMQLRERSHHDEPAARLEPAARVAAAAPGHPGTDGLLRDLKRQLQELRRKLG